MLIPRILTALVLLALLLPALFANDPRPFAVLTLVMLGAGGWEWGRLNQYGQVQSLLLGGAVVAICGLMASVGWLTSAPALGWWVVCLAWTLGGAWLLAKGPGAWLLLSRTLRCLMGLVILCAAWLALSALRARGVGFLLSVFCVVWMADIAAYFGGRAFGKRKLAVTISPGKSWEGAWTGAVGVQILAWVWMWLERTMQWPPGSVFDYLLAHGGYFGLVAGLLMLGALSVVGDLFESLVKRAVGAKDSSKLLPGHGGVLDRVDALLPVLPAAMALTCW